MVKIQIFPSLKSPIKLFGQFWKSKKVTKTEILDSQMCPKLEVLQVRPISALQKDQKNRFGLS